MNQKLKLFISHSNVDEVRIKEFIKHMSPYVNNNSLELWHDNLIMGGEPFQDIIDVNLSSADIICLFISADYLSSPKCLQEKERALKLKSSKGLRVIPIILSPCAWEELDDISSLLALPNGAKAISTYSDESIGWVEIVSQISKVCKNIKAIQILKLTPEFEVFLNSSEILTKSHSQKEELLLKDIFVYPNLKKYDEIGDTKKYNSIAFHEDILCFGKIIIEGESQSGKTTICKLLFTILKSLRHIPIYIIDDNSYLGNPQEKIRKAFSSQYQDADFSKIDQSRIVPILDNFHFAKNKNKYIEAFKEIKHQILIVDDIFGLSIKNETLIKEYHKFKLIQFCPILRRDLIEKWINIKENDSIELNPNHLYQSVDQKTEIIENILGKIHGKGIMPAYPFFILSILAAHEAQKPLDQEITTQGYCYQVLIILFLKKQGVKNENIDVYTNLLTELSFHIYNNHGNGLSDAELEEFYKDYRLKFNLPLTTNEMKKVLVKVNICNYNNFNTFNFSYKYIYYFFVAKKLAENINNSKTIINRILNNLHKNENAYITVFISHHSKSTYLLDELLLNAEILFEKYVPATLSSNELIFFDKHENNIIKAILPEIRNNPIEKREEILNRKAIKESREEISHSLDNDENEKDIFDFSRELRRSIKTVEVMGLIIKNHSGSMDLDRLKYIFEQAMKVHLRILTCFFEAIQSDSIEDFFIDFIRERLRNIIEEKEEKISDNEMESIARKIFWNINFGVIHAYITKIIQSIGSANLIKVANTVCKKENTPASHIINHGILMWYNKNIKTEEIHTIIEKEGFSKTAKILMIHKIVEHIRLHPININEVNAIGKKLGIPTKNLIHQKNK